MTANQRRPGFRLPWSSEEDGTPNEGGPAATETPPTATPEAAVSLEPVADAVAAPANGQAPVITQRADSMADTEATSTVDRQNDAPDAPAAGEAEPAADVSVATDPTPTREPAATASAPETGDDFMRDLVAAMRAVADEARDAGMAELRAKADEQVRRLETDAEHRREDLRGRADADVAGIGEWARAEAERIKQEAEQRVVSRRAQLEQQLAADTSRTDADTKAVRDRVADYERELEAYHAQLAEINDPAAFAAAAKRLPKAPPLIGRAEPATAAAPLPTTSAVAAEPLGSNGVPGEADAQPAEVLATRLAELDATLDSSAEGASTATTSAAGVAESSVAGPTAAAPVAEPTTAEEPAPAPAANGPSPAASTDSSVTEVVVKGLGSFGAITGFRQSLSGVEGIESVALSLGQTGEFVFRATHGAGFDVRAAIVSLEGDGAKVEERPEGGLRVTLERAR